MSLRLCGEPEAKGGGQPPGKNTRAFRKSAPGKGLGAGEKIFPELALSSRQGQRPCTPWVAASGRAKLEDPSPRGKHRRPPCGKAA